jgi:hypothetical protein
VARKEEVGAVEKGLKAWLCCERKFQDDSKQFSMTRDRAVIGLLVIAITVGCSSGASPQPDGPVDAAIDAPCFPLDGPSPSDGATVSFSGDVLPLLQICANFECHGSLAGGLDLRPGHQYMSLVGMPAGECGGGRLYVDPGHSERSYMIDKLRGSICHCAGGRMPLGGPYLAGGDMATIMTWIDQGAAND